jgi:hypothetical protein
MQESGVRSQESGERIQKGVDGTEYIGAGMDAASEASDWYLSLF